MLENIYALLEALTRQQHSLVTSLDAKEVRRSSHRMRPVPYCLHWGLKVMGALSYVCAQDCCMHPLMLAATGLAALSKPF